MTINEAQEMRKQGYTVVTNRTLSRVLLVTKDEDKAYELKARHLKKGRVVKIWGKLNRWHISDKEREEYLKAPSLYTL